MERVGIIGYGSFGSLLAQLLAPHLPVVVYDVRPITVGKLPAHVTAVNFAVAAASPLVIIATNLAAMERVVSQVAAYVSPASIVMDICSVKVLPAQLLSTYLGNKCRLLAAHPMFGPGSVAASNGTCRGATLVWHELRGGPFPDVEHLFATQLGLRLQPMTPDDHDRDMAWVHALPFFVGRTLLEMDIPDVSLDTGYFQKLQALVALERTHSRELFETVELGNPYAAAVRQQLFRTLQKLNTTLTEID